MLCLKALSLRNLPKKKAEGEEEDLGPTIEETIEIERKALDLSKCTPVTLERFLAWKEEKKKKESGRKRKKTSSTKNWR